MKTLPLMLVALFVSCANLAHGAGDKKPDPNEVVLEAAKGIKDGGGYDRSWKGTGAPEDVEHKEVTILGKSEQGSYCCGYTFVVVMRAAEKLNLLDDKTPAQLKAFQKEWYGATPKDKEILCAFALENLKIGKRVEAKNAKAGDFLQFWRTSRSGHSVVFLEWVGDGDKPIGFRYRSSQGSTNGIGDNVEYFSDAEDKRGKVDRERMYFGRLGKG